MYSWNISLHFATLTVYDIELYNTIITVNYLNAFRKDKRDLNIKVTLSISPPTPLVHSVVIRYPAPSIMLIESSVLED